jgi:hypothetical protein
MQDVYFPVVRKQQPKLDPLSIHPHHLLDPFTPAGA